MYWRRLYQSGSVDHVAQLWREIEQATSFHGSDVVSGGGCVDREKSANPTSVVGEMAFVAWSHCGSEFSLAPQSRSGRSEGASLPDKFVYLALTLTTFRRMHISSSVYSRIHLGLLSQDTFAGQGRWMIPSSTAVKTLVGRGA